MSTLTDALLMMHRLEEGVGTVGRRDALWDFSQHSVCHRHTSVQRKRTEMTPLQKNALFLLGWETQFPQGNFRKRSIASTQLVPAPTQGPPSQSGEQAGDETKNENDRGNRGVSLRLNNAPMEMVTGT